MTKPNYWLDRRTFLAAVPAMALPATATAADDRINVIGPKTGYTPHIGALVSMLAWNQRTIPSTVRGLTQAQLDKLFDAKSNTIGGLLLHLGATETYYALHTFQGMPWGSWPDEVKKIWDPAMELSDAGRAAIKGHDLDYYLKMLDETRQKSLAEFRKRDDAWLLAVDEKWGWGPTNNYCKWFHVCEHISHHVGQMAWLRSRV